MSSFTFHAPVFQVNDIVVKDMDCCAVLPILKECGDDLTLTVTRNPLASGQLAAINGGTSIDTPLSLTQSKLLSLTHDSNMSHQSMTDSFNYQLHYCVLFIQSTLQADCNY